MNEQPRKGDRPSSLRFAGAGIELAGAVLVSAGLGFAADTFFAWEGDWGFLIGGLLGFALGLANLLRLAAAYNRD
ncbi:AtpZ/AtpI family protein [Planctomycetaceae bacterium SH139]